MTRHPIWLYLENGCVATASAIVLVGWFTHRPTDTLGMWVIAIYAHLRHTRWKGRQCLPSGGHDSAFDQWFRATQSWRPDSARLASDSCHAPE